MNSEFIDLMMNTQYHIQAFASKMSEGELAEETDYNSVANTSTTGTNSSNSSQAATRRTHVPKCIDKTKTLLPADFEPSEYSIICGNKRKYFNSPGNSRLRELVKSFLPEFSKAEGKVEKGRVVTKVMEITREACPVGAFVALEDGRWWEVSERTSREKVGSYFRDGLANRYSSSAQNKIAKRKTKRAENKKQKVAAVMKPEPVASHELTGLQALQMSSSFPRRSNSLPDITQLTSLPNFLQQQQHQMQQQQQNMMFLPRRFAQQEAAQQQTNFLINDEDSSISSGTSASFYDVDDLTPVPIMEL